MPASLWGDPGTWIALGISALFIVVGIGMHRVIVKVLKNQSDPAQAAQPADSLILTGSPSMTTDVLMGNSVTEPDGSSRTERTRA
mgnify:CR=1 FL=1